MMRRPLLLAAFTWSLVGAASCDGARTVEARCGHGGDDAGTCDDAGRPLCVPACAGGAVCALDGRCSGALAWRVTLPSGLPHDLSFEPASRSIVTTTSTSPTLPETEVAVHAFDERGGSLWSRALDVVGSAGDSSRATIAPDGKLYVAVGYALFSLAPSGELRWRLDQGSWIGMGVSRISGSNAPSITDDGTLISQYYAAVGDDAAIRWVYSARDTGCSPIALGDVTLVFEPAESTLSDAKITALGRDGRVVWSTGTQGRGCEMVPARSPAGAWDRFVTTECAEGCSSTTVLVAHTDSGVVISRRSLPPGITVQLHAVFPDGRTVATASRRMGADLAHELMILDPQATEDAELVIASVPLPQPINHVVLGDDDMIYATTTDSVVAIRDARVVWSWHPEHAAFTAGPVISPAGCLALPVVTYRRESSASSQRVLDWTNQILCLNTTARGLARSPWPRTNGGHHSAYRAELTGLTPR